MRLLIVEDDVALRESLANALREQGYTVDEAGTAGEGQYFAEEYAIGLAIIDLGLPDYPGGELVKRLRDDGKDFPILILTARGDWQDKVAGLNAGADDYVVKPFNTEELNARINALLRRAAGSPSAELKVGPVLIDTLTQAVSVDGREVTVTGYEYRLLECLMMNAGRVISKASLTDQLYDQDFDRDSNVLEVLITRLRKKLDPERRGLIENLRGRGYRIKDSQS